MTFEMSGLERERERERERKKLKKRHKYMNMYCKKLYQSKRWAIFNAKMSHKDKLILINIQAKIDADLRNQRFIVPDVGSVSARIWKSSI